MSVQDAMAHRQKHKPNKIVMKDLILKALFSRVGPAIKAIVSGILGKLVTWAASLGIMMDASLQQSIALSLTGIIWLAIDYYVNKYAGDHAETIQKAYGLEADRWLGPKTTAAAVNPEVIPRPTEILP
jgi:hypothetical protein